ncbi:1-(5-phosphoribosyl)-5-amino-4-imidazole-carboxylate carboxylase [Spirochaetia bacterium]|nr:1-(5-phosphoribosyl)-5-amino-4-imidazole-carboxylate carboxylase [Spirochaetia bacterium]
MHNTDDLGFANLDICRQERTGYPEVIYFAGKTTAQSLEIIKKMRGAGVPVFGTRAQDELAATVLREYPDARYDGDAKTISIGEFVPQSERRGLVLVAAAGTSDLRTAKEAYNTAEFFGSNVKLLCDIGIAGIHRIFDHIDEIKQARVIIAAAGMEGALAGVLAGLVRAPVIALPTSVGYGVAQGGIAALLSMLSSCAPGIACVNIDNGFGAGYMANMINRMGGELPR